MKDQNLLNFLNSIDIEMKLHLKFPKKNLRMKKTTIKTKSGATNGPNKDKNGITINAPILKTLLFKKELVL